MLSAPTAARVYISAMSPRCGPPSGLAHSRSIPIRMTNRSAPLLAALALAACTRQPAPVTRPTPNGQRAPGGQAAAVAGVPGDSGRTR